MIAIPFRYEKPSSLADVLGLLKEPGAKVIAGGMSLVPMMKLRLAAPELLIDFSGVPGQKEIAQVNGHLNIGPMLTHAELEFSGPVRRDCPLLAATAARIGDVQVRNVGTIGGSVAHADPAADYPAALLALESQLTLTNARGQRTVAASDFFVDTFTTALTEEELITSVQVPRDPPSTGTAYEKKVQPASGFAMVGIAARITMAGGVIKAARIGVTGVAGKPYRALKVEQLLEGTAGSPEDAKKAAAAIAEGVDVNTDIHASADYRAHLARVFAARAIGSAIRRAGAQA
jgi:carbon-monoxide dehydrogenase medium subunit